MIQQPAFPASTVAVTNTTGQTAQVTITGGTVTSINVNAVQVATSSPYMASVPAGQTIAVTYTGSPAWYWSVLTPAVPSSTVAVANTTGRDISVVLSGGTVTHVTINGTDRATSTPANVMLPAGESITLTYSGAPVWAWMDFLDLAMADSLGTAYAQPNTIAPTGVSGYDPANALPYASHAATGATGYGTGVSN